MFKEISRIRATATSVLTISVLHLGISEIRAAETPPPAYCEFLQASNALISEGDQRFEDDDYEARSEWIGIEEEKLAASVTEKLGLPLADWLYAASQNNWSMTCEADERGWVAIREEDAEGVTDDDVDAVQDAIVLQYLWQMENEPDQFFDPAKYSTVNCREAEVRDYRFLGCRMRSFSYASEFDIYIVANADGESVATPYDNEALDRNADRQNIGQGEYIVPLGKFIGTMPLVDYTEIRLQIE